MIDSSSSSSGGTFSVERGMPDTLPSVSLKDLEAEIRFLSSSNQNMSRKFKQALAESKEVPATSKLHLRDFLMADDGRFVVLAYRVLLLRDPDPEGFEHYYKRALYGESRLRILASIAGSVEGRINNVKVPGLTMAKLKLRLASIPLIGPILSNLMGYDELRELAMRRFALIEERLESISFAQESSLVTQERRLNDIQGLLIALLARFDGLGGRIEPGYANNDTSTSDSPSEKIESPDNLVNLNASVSENNSAKSIFDTPVILTDTDGRDVIRDITKLVMGSLEAKLLAKH